MPTVKEIAKYTGVSPSTVSIVLGGKAKERKISQETQQKVLQAARELGYQPNIAARRLRDRNSQNKLVIAVFWANDFRALMVVRFLRGLNRVLDPQQAEVLIHPYTSGRLAEEESLYSTNSFHAAIICNADEADLAFLEQGQVTLPLVLYNRHSAHYSTVNIDDHRIGCTPAEVFAARGHKRVAVLASEAYIAGLDVATGTDVRTLSFCRRCRELGLEVVLQDTVANALAGGHQAGLRLCALDQRPTALFCASDAIAFGALRAFQEQGLRVPDQLELIAVGNGDAELEEYSWPSLSVMRLPMEEMAEECYRIIMATVADEIKPPYSVELPVAYLARESCGEPPAR